MSDKLSNIIRIALLVIGLIFGVVYFLGIQGKTDPEVVELAQTDFIAYLTYAFFILAAVITVVAPIIIIAKNPKSAVSALIGIVALGVLFFVAYLLASGAVDSTVMQKKETAESTSKLVGTGILLTYILAGLALVTMAASSLTRMFK